MNAARLVLTADLVISPFTLKLQLTLLPGNLPNPGIKPVSPALQADSLLSEPPGKPLVYYEKCTQNFEFIK